MDDVHARLRELEERVNELEEGRLALRRAFNRLGDALTSTHDRAGIIAAVLDTSVLMLPAGVAVFYELVPGRHALRPAATTGRAVTLGELAVGRGVAGACARLLRVVRTGGGLGDEAAEVARPDEPPAAHAVAVPVRQAGELLGVVALYDRGDGVAFSDDDVDTLRTLVGQMETAVENIYLYEEAKHLSLTDGLTAVWNRRQFNLRLSEEIQRGLRFQESFGVLLTDLDRFKAVNDGYGHQVGDAVLVELAARLTSATREVDVVARFGGDEFALLLPRTGLAGSRRLADKLRAGVSDEPFVVGDRTLAITMSVGLATYPEHGSSDKELVDAADRALYRAKDHGGNRVEHAKANPWAAAAGSRR